ncbi:MAG: pilus assembly protein PilM [Candidatus Marinimicrobia bacterium]|nr:pilus assembly protein PilM [Candidatus Neomarinimicrobiota bacterium]
MAADDQTDSNAEATDETSQAETIFEEFFDVDLSDSDEDTDSSKESTEDDELDLVFKDFADETDDKETEDDTEEELAFIDSESDDQSTDDDSDKKSEEANQLNGADDSGDVPETPDDLDISFDAIDLPLVDEEPAEEIVEANQIAETVELEVASDVESKALAESNADEDFEDFADELDDQSGEPTAFIYKKKSKIDIKGMLQKVKGASGRIGLDIGSYAIKFIDAQESSGVTTINDFSYVRIPPELNSDSEKLSQFIKSTVKEYLTTGQNRKKKLNYLLNGSDISIKSIHMPKVGKKELKEAVRWATRKQLSFKADEAVLDYKVINELVEDGIPKLDILVVAAHDGLINSSIDLLSQIKIPYKMTLVPLAAWRSFMSHYPTENAANVMVLDIGHSSTMINVINRGNIRFAREVGIAGRDFTASLVGNLNSNTGDRIHIDEVKAEALKHLYGLPHGVQEKLVSEEGLTLSDIASRIRSPLERLANEIQRSMQYYSKEFPYGPIEKVFLCGGSSVLQNLDVFLSETLNQEVIVFDPISVWNYESNISDLGTLQKNANALAIPAGMALDNSSELNLLPEKLAQETQNVLLKFMLKSLALIVVLATFSISTLIGLKSNDLSGQLETLQEELSQLSPMQKNFISLQNVEKDISSKLKSLNSLSNKPTVDVQIFKILSNIMPGHITLNTMSVTDPKLRPVKAHISCSGFLLASAYNANVALADFIMNLDNSGYIGANTINLNNSFPFENNNRTGIFFEIEFDIINEED